MPATEVCYDCDGEGKICDECEEAASSCECDEKVIEPCPDCGGCGEFCVECELPTDACDCEDDEDDD